MGKQEDVKSRAHVIRRGVWCSELGAVDRQVPGHLCPGAQLGAYPPQYGSHGVQPLCFQRWKQQQVLGSWILCSIPGSTFTSV